MINSDSCSSVCMNRTRGVSSPPQDGRTSSTAAYRYISFLLSRTECRTVSSTVLYVGPRFNFFLSETTYSIYSIS